MRAWSDASRYAGSARLDPRVAALLHERRQPARFELAPDHDEEIGALQPEDEAGLRLDEVRILVAARDRFDRRPIAGDLARDRRQILGRRDHVEFPLRPSRRGHDQRHETGKNDFLHNFLTDYRLPISDY